MHTFQELKRAAKQVNVQWPVVRMALAGDTATQLLATGLRGEAALRALNLELFEADYGNMERELLQADSPLRQHDAQYVLVYRSVHNFAARHAMCAPEKCADWVAEELAFYETLLADPYFSARTLIALNMPMLDDGIYGGFAPNVQESLPNQIRALNFGLQQLAQQHKNFAVCDIDALQAAVGRENLFDEAVFTTTEIEFRLTALPQVCERLVNMLCVRRGTLRKVLVTDLDNTIWGGVVSEDGLGGLQLGHALGIGRAYSDVQRWMKKLVQRGVVLCVVSKNDEAVAREPFDSHPDMILGLDDVAVFLANWENKADNILRLAEILHIGTDQMVFLDDNPFERNLVRQGVPDVCVPELPEDPARWVRFLSELHLFDTASVSESDAQRTEQYRREAARVSFRQRFAGEDEFLASLEMTATVEGLNAFNTPRVAQLTQRSNQFNLRTRRYTEVELQHTELISLCFSLADRFGNHGLVAVVLLERKSADTLFIDTWLMSCRVLRRGMEHFVANTIVDTARALGISQLTAEYIPTAKNGMVANLLPLLGFKPAPICTKCVPNGIPIATAPTAVPYVLRVADYNPKPVTIVLKKDS